MKFIIVLAVLLIANFVNTASISGNNIKTFEEFKRVYNKLYANAEEEAIRRQNFLESLKYVNENEDAELNHLADLSIEEFQQQYLMSNEQVTELASNDDDVPTCKIPEIKQVPKSIDLRQLKTLTEIKNQLSCGSCWAFSAVAATESAFLAKNISVTLSEQELVDCASKHGCRGEKVSTGFEYIVKNGLVTEEEYPYYAREMTCQKKEGKRYKLTSFCMIEGEKDDSIMKILSTTHSAVSVIIGIRNMNQFRFYNGKTIISKDSGFMDNWHGVAIVGYGTRDNVDYWIVRNSWGKSWGESGYAYFERHHDLMHINDWPQVAIV